MPIMDGVIKLQIIRCFVVLLQHCFCFPQLTQHKSVPFIIPMETSEEMFFQVTKDPDLLTAYQMALQNDKVAPFHNSLISAYLMNESTTDAVFCGK